MSEEKTTEISDLDALQKERDEYLAGWKRAQADYANLQKEMEKARQDYAKYASEDCLMKLLPAIDQYLVALRFQPSLDAITDKDERRKFETWVTGLQAVSTLWMQAAKECGLEQVTTTGPLDPSQHEAVSEEESETVPSGEIIRIAEAGWKLNGKLLRPAKVIISKGIGS
jgi:molecular chaperone GrpE